MPTYEYICNDCSHFFEKFQNMKDKPLTECPACGSSVRRIISSGAGIILKGNGFYQTDYKKRSCPAASGTDKNKPACPKSGICPSCESDA